MMRAEYVDTGTSRASALAEAGYSPMEGSIVTEGASKAQQFGPHSQT
jgi:hypothetical protein